MVAKYFFRADTGPVLYLMVGAVGLAAFHLGKLATDPHTPYSKEGARLWEQRVPPRYAVVRWKDVMEKVSH